MNVKPLGDHVLVEVDLPPETTAVGIILPQTTQGREQMSQGKVVAVGPGRRNDQGEWMPLTVKAGDRILFNWGGTDVEIDRNEYRIMTEGDILAVLD